MRCDDADLAASLCIALCFSELSVLHCVSLKFLHCTDPSLHFMHCTIVLCFSQLYALYRSFSELSALHYAFPNFMHRTDHSLNFMHCTDPSLNFMEQQGWCHVISFRFCHNFQCNVKAKMWCNSCRRSSLAGSAVRFPEGQNREQWR